MKRRAFITLLGGAAASWPLAARAQHRSMPVIGFLRNSTAAGSERLVSAFRRGLNEVGFVEGQNIAIEYRWADNQNDQLTEMAADLIRRRVSVIVAPGGTSAVLAVKTLTTTIPIVFSGSVDPVQSGLVQSLNRPGGNITGITDMASDIAGKQFGLLHELLPRAVRFALLVNPSGASTEATVLEVRSAASAINRQLDVYRAHTHAEIDTAFATLAQQGADALLVGPNPLFSTRRVQLATQAIRHAIPTIHSQREFAEVGGLMSYGSNFADRERQLGIYAGRILKGEKPADLPVLRASKFEFVINLQTAKILDLEVPPTLLARADEVIE
jgi:putative ABC transport system substrate-binding protein